MIRAHVRPTARHVSETKFGHPAATEPQKSGGPAQPTNRIRRIINKYLLFKVTTFGGGLLWCKSKLLQFAFFVYLLTLCLIFLSFWHGVSISFPPKSPTWERRGSKHFMFLYFRHVECSVMPAASGLVSPFQMPPTSLWLSSPKLTKFHPFYGGQIPKSPLLTFLSECIIDTFNLWSSRESSEGLIYDLRFHLFENNSWTYGVLETGTSAQVVFTMMGFWTRQCKQQVTGYLCWK